ncbi:PREDICTED: uncharacterized protein LOC104724628 [Camelina sativa]|uniref:Uncharacterized protein LOC104724628 n=1 Tax=Camelina sativa TaxID=90675 RepID=A0ABM0UI31_CAMSA|nr:PREDICTED: uncharacterized protein LOC104724628 [Camelina sativa]XP_019090737.1 PREDICTED: uncharacterized protein LOC104724628 [Camelina sativa]
MLENEFYAGSYKTDPFCMEISRQRTAHMLALLRLNHSKPFCYCRCRGAIWFKYYGVQGNRIGSSNRKHAFGSSQWRTQPFIFVDNFSQCPHAWFSITLSNLHRDTSCMEISRRMQLICSLT